MMRIQLLLGEVVPHGGIQRYNRQLIQAAREVAQGAGGEIAIYSLNDDPDTAGLSGFGRRHAAFVRSALSDARRDRPDVVLIGHVKLAPLALAYRAFSPSIRTYVVTHGKEVETRLPRAERSALRICTGVLSVSESTRSLVASIQRVPKERIHVLHYGFDPRRVWDSPAVMDRTGRNLTLLSVARLDEHDAYKGIDTTIEAIAALKDRHPDMRYVVVGDGSDKSRLVKLASDLGVSERVVFAGTVCDDTLRELYRQSDIFTLPSTHEGLGIVYLEAMSYGKPVIGVLAGGVADAVVHEMNGLLVQRKSRASVAAAITRLAADGELRRRLGRWGREYTVPAFSSKRMEESLARILCAGSPTSTRRAA